jgi:hypothetical protein
MLKNLQNSTFGPDRRAKFPKMAFEADEIARNDAPDLQSNVTIEFLM